MTDSPATSSADTDQPRHGRIHLHEYDPIWPKLFAAESDAIMSALGDMAVRIEHVGSTSVVGIAAKPIIDIVLEVPDSTNEAAYVPALEAVGYEFRFREPEWWQHRLFKRTNPAVNLHVFTTSCPEVARMLRFRDRLRSDVSDRQLYEQTKRTLADRDWKTVQDYADAKSEIVETILARSNSVRG